MIAKRTGGKIIMNLIELYFGKQNIEDLCYEDLERLHGIKESEIIEYKKTDTNNNKISETVCAFANSSGGLLVIGVEECEEYPKNFIGIKKDKDEKRILRAITDKIKYPVAGIKAKSVFNPSSKKYIIVLQIPKSLTTPHFHNNRVLIRIGEQDRPAPLGIIEGLFGKRDIGCNIEFEIRGSLGKNIIKRPGTGYNSDTNIYVKNIGKESPKKFVVKLVFKHKPSQLGVNIKPPPGIPVSWGKNPSETKETIEQISVIDERFALPPDCETGIGILEIKKTGNMPDSTPLKSINLEYGIYADNMHSFEREITIQVKD